MFMLTDSLLVSGESRAEASVTGPERGPPGTTDQRFKSSCLAGPTTDGGLSRGPDRETLSRLHSWSSCDGSVSRASSSSGRSTAGAGGRKPEGEPHIAIPDFSPMAVICFAPHLHMASTTGLRLWPIGMREYSTRGGTSA